MIGLMDMKPGNDEEVEPWKDSEHLQPNVKPLLYNLMFKPQYDLARFYGRETITVEVKSQTSYFAVHAKNLNITSSTVSTTLSDEITSLNVKKSFSYGLHDFWVIQMENPVRPGIYNIDLEFERSSKNEIRGLFKGTYFSDKMDMSRHIIATKFKPLGAREIYPCFDEPQFKAKYKIKLVRPMDSYIALTNEIIEKEEFGPDKNEITVFFKETNPMSTFLSGFIITDVKDSSPTIVENQSSKLTIKLHSVPDKIDKTVFAAEIAVQVTKFFINYFEIPFPLEKLDFIGLPNFPIQALEQWGFVTFNELCLLYDERLNSAEEKKRTALLIAREVCRQWFGCLVTMKWWDDFWLSEGFVRFMQFKALEEGVKSCVDWKLTEQLIHDIIYPVMDADAVVTAHPLHVKIENSEYVDRIFDDITYGKSVAVLKMVESFVGRDNFQKGIHRFLDSFTLSNATASDFWNSMNTEINDPDVNVGNVVDTWTKQSGYPVIYAIRRANTWVLSQSRFLMNRNSYCNASDSPYRYKWDVPIHYITSNDKKPVLVWFRKTEECIKIMISDRNVCYLKFNHAQTGFYRVNYEGCLWRQFAQLLTQDHKRLDCIDRANLLDDVFHLAEAGQADYHYAFELLKYMGNEQEFLPWSTASRNLKKLLNRLPNTPCYGVLLVNTVCLLLWNYWNDIDMCKKIITLKFLALRKLVTTAKLAVSKLIRSLVGRLYGSAEGQYSWNLSSSDSQLKRLLRVVILELGCISKLPECLSDLSVKFKEWIKSGQMPVHPDLRRLLLRYGMREFGTFEDWDTVWTRFQKETNNSLKNTLLECLANVKEQWAIVGLLEDTRNELCDTDYFLFLQYLLENPYCGGVYWTFVRNEWDYLVERFSSRKRDLLDFVMLCTSKFNMKSQLEEVEQFYKNHDGSEFESDAKALAIEKINCNIMFCERYKDVISSWVLENLNIIV